MRTSHYTDQQLKALLAEVEASPDPAGVCRHYGLSMTALYRLKRRLAHEPTNLRVTRLEVENARLRETLEDQAQALRALRDLVEKGSPP